MTELQCNNPYSPTAMGLNDFLFTELLHESNTNICAVGLNSAQFLVLILLYQFCSNILLKRHHQICAAETGCHGPVRLRDEKRRGPKPDWLRICRDSTRLNITTSTH